MIRIPGTGRRTRLAALAYGLILLVWLSLEDQTVGPVALLGLGLGLIVVTLTIFAKLGGMVIAARLVPLGLLLVGVLVGVAGCIAAVLLMFFKNALHAHLYLDFPPGLMLAMLARTPAWALAGGLAGLGIGLGWLALRRESE
jgi:hypothetical protein